MDSNRTDHQGRTVDFGRTSADYERHRPGFPETFFDRLESQNWIRSGQRALDLGTGTGSLALGFAARGLHAVGLDIAPELLEAARATARARNLTIEFIAGRAEATGREPASFDVVSAGQCWWWFDEGPTMQEVAGSSFPADDSSSATSAISPCQETSPPKPKRSSSNTTPAGQRQDGEASIPNR